MRMGAVVWKSTVPLECSIESIPRGRDQRSPGDQVQVWRPALLPLPYRLHFQGLPLDQLCVLRDTALGSVARDD